MNVTFAYKGHSAVLESPAGWQALRLVPNLARDPVGFDGQLRHPLRFREAMSALHDTVISDRRFKKRDKTAYLQWKKDQAQRKASLRRDAVRRAVAEAITKAGAAVSPDLQSQYHRHRKRYWAARQAYTNYLLKHDIELWRRLMPCDPVITVADDVVFFECFSADESSYGCLTVNRGEGFTGAENAQYGTTNVDYSWDLYNHFQSLRSYRQTRLSVDPEGFTVKTAPDAADYREEKIDLPQGWLRGFMQLLSAMSMPMQRITLSRDAVYAILAWHQRHRAHRSPRAIRFELINGQPPRIVLEPWERAITSHGTKYEGPDVAAIRVWGGRRLTVLNRILPLADHFDIYLLGTGLPSFWVANMGEMRLTLGLSGWTANDWTKGSALDLIAPPAAPSPDLVDNVCAYVREQKGVTLADVQKRWNLDAATALAALRQLAHSGQVIHDLVAGLYRWRQVMPKVIGESQIGPEHEELRGAREIMAQGKADLTGREEAPAPTGGYVLTGRIASHNVEILVDADQRIKRGKCICGWYQRYGLKNGPCRHMLALRWRAYAGALEAYRKSGWYNRLLGKE